MQAGKNAQWLRAQTALSEDLGSIPSIHIAAHTVITVPEDPMPSYSLHGNQAHTYYTNIHAGKHPYIQNKT